MIRRTTPILLAMILASPLQSVAGSAKLPNRNTPLDDVTFVAFDTETTGFSPTKDRVLECGAVKFKNGKILEEKTWLINPHKKISYWAEQTHGITQDSLTNSPSFKEFYPEFRDFAKGTVLLAHNARFDVSFMSEEIKRSGYPEPPNRTIDSLKLFRKWFPDAESHSLSELTKLADVETGIFHRAEADALYIYLILDKKLKDHKNVKTLGDLYDEAGGTLKF